MKPRDRTWKAVRWIGAFLTVVLLGMWVVSGWYSVGFSCYPTAGVGFSSGELLIAWDRSWSIIPEMCSTYASRHSMQYSWWFYYVESPYSNTPMLVIPFWCLVLLTAVPTALMFRSDRRRRRIEAQTLCAKCGYSKIGLPANHTCPECGTAN